MLLQRKMTFFRAPHQLHLVGRSRRAALRSLPLIKRGMRVPVPVSTSAPKLRPAQTHAWIRYPSLTLTLSLSLSTPPTNSYSSGSAHPTLTRTHAPLSAYKRKEHHRPIRTYSRIHRLAPLVSVSVGLSLTLALYRQPCQQSTPAASPSWCPPQITTNRLSLFGDYDEDAGPALH